MPRIARGVEGGSSLAASAGPPDWDRGFSALPAPFGALFDPPLELLPGLLLEVPFDPLDCAVQTVAQSNPIAKSAMTEEDQPKWRGTRYILITFLVVLHSSRSLKLRSTPAKPLRLGPKGC